MSSLISNKILATTPGKKLKVEISYPPNAITGVREPSAKQKLLHAANKKFKFYVGGVGTGKTLFGSFETMRYAWRINRNRIFVGANTYKQLKEGTMQTFFDVVPKWMIKEYNKSDMKVTLVNDTDLLFRSYDSASDVLSLEFGGIWMDEGALALQEYADHLIGRLRNRRCIEAGVIECRKQGVTPNSPEGIAIRKSFFLFLVTSNPAGKNWVYEYGYKNPSEDTIGVQSSIYENASNLPPGYIEDMEHRYNEVNRKRFLFGSFDYFEGQIYTDWDEKVHVIKPFDIPDHWYRFRTFDFGYRNPSAVLWIAEDEEGRLYIYRELYQSGLLARELGQKVLELSTGDPEYQYNIGDTSGRSAGQVSKDHGENIFKQMEEEAGIRIRPADKQDLLGGINRVAMMLKGSMIEGKHVPEIFIFNTCPAIIRELPNYQWEPPPHGAIGNYKERPLKANDHTLDALRYLVTSRPDRRKLPMNPDLLPKDQVKEHKAKPMPKKKRQKSPW